MKRFTFVSDCDSDRLNAKDDQIAKVFVDGTPADECVAIITTRTAICYDVDPDSKKIRLIEDGTSGGYQRLQPAYKLIEGRVTWQTNADIAAGKEPHQ